MKKLLGTVLIFILISGLFSGCGNKKESVNPNNSGINNPTINTKAKVFKANELLSPEEASAIVGTNITLEEGTLKIDNETGTSNTYYDYELTPSTTLAALFRLVQNGTIPKDKFVAGITASGSYDNELKMSGTNAEILNGLGDKAFIHKTLGQVNVLYKDYYILIGFGEDNYDKSKELNINIAKKIIENIDKKK